MCKGNVEVLTGTSVKLLKTPGVDWKGKKEGGVDRLSKGAASNR